MDDSIKLCRTEYCPYLALSVSLPPGSLLSRRARITFVRDQKNSLIDSIQPLLAAGRSNDQKYNTLFNSFSPDLHIQRLKKQRKLYKTFSWRKCSLCLVKDSTVSTWHCRIWTGGLAAVIIMIKNYCCCWWRLSACSTANGQCQIGNFSRVSPLGQYFWYKNIQVIAALGFWHPIECKSLN